jgi:hypothetical protein
MFNEMNDIDRMMIAITEHGEDEMWNEIESTPNAIIRFRLRDHFFKAKEKLGK